MVAVPYAPRGLGQDLLTKQEALEHSALLSQVLRRSFQPTRLVLILSLLSAKSRIVSKENAERGAIQEFSWCQITTLLWSHLHTHQCFQSALLVSEGRLPASSSPHYPSHPYCIAQPHYNTVKVNKQVTTAKAEEHLRAEEMAWWLKNSLHKCEHLRSNPQILHKSPAGTVTHL